MYDLVFYTHPISRGRGVRWMLHECQAHYETHYLTFNGTMKSDEYLKINPMGKVPAIIHKGQVITEAAAIITYLADIFPEAGLAPDNRAEYYRWIFFFSGPVEAAIIDTLLKADKSPKAQAISGYGSLELTIKALEQHLENREFIVGDHFTAADIIATNILNFGYKMGVIHSETLDQYRKTMCNRSAFKDAQQIDNEKSLEMAQQ